MTTIKILTGYGLPKYVPDNKPITKQHQDGWKALMSTLHDVLNEPKMNRVDSFEKLAEETPRPKA